MTETSNMNINYNRIITELQLLNPRTQLEEIELDVKKFLYNLFIDEIETRKFSKDISTQKIKKDIIKQKLQSSRQPIKLRDIKDGRIKKETKQLRLKKIQDSFNRKAFFDTLDYPGNFRKQELFYINHTDKTYDTSGISKNEINENQKIIPGLKQAKNSSYQTIDLNEVDENAIKIKSELPEIQEVIDIFKNVEGKEEPKTKDTNIIELEQELRDRILKLKLKPIIKEKSEDINLLDYVGFVDKNRDNNEE